MDAVAVDADNLGANGFALRRTLDWKRHENAEDAWYGWPAKDA
jgi:hypothetical protein